MYLLAIFGGHKSYEDRDIKVELATSFCDIGRFSKSGIPIYNSKVLEKIGRRIQAIAKRYALQVNAIRTV